jgi:hypothetical protein
VTCAYWKKDTVLPSVQQCPRLPDHLLRNARVLSARDAILPLLPKGKVICEVGVGLGDFSDRFIRVCEPKTFIAIDLFDLHLLSELWEKPISAYFGDRTHGAFFRDRFAELIRQRRMLVLEGDSAAMLSGLADRSVDIFYVDANHFYESVSRELSIIKDKVADDGLIILNDYIMTAAGYDNVPYGVIQATNEFMVRENWEMIYFALHNYMYCDVVLRKAMAEPTATGLLARASAALRRLWPARRA